MMSAFKATLCSKIYISNTIDLEMHSKAGVPGFLFLSFCFLNTLSHFFIFLFFFFPFFRSVFFKSYLFFAESVEIWLCWQRNELIRWTAKFHLSSEKLLSCVEITWPVESYYAKRNASWVIDSVRNTSGFIGNSTWIKILLGNFYEIDFLI